MTAFPFSILPFFGAEALLISFFAVIVKKSTKQALLARVAGVGILTAIALGMEAFIVSVCMSSGRPHWAATVASLLWVQLMSASELLLVSRVDGTQLRGSAVYLLWNMRRVGTQWQVKNVPPSPAAQSRTGFIVRRMAVVLAAYLFVDIIASMPPPDPALVAIDKTSLVAMHKLDTNDMIFRFAMVVSYWITTATLNLFMTNVSAVVTVLLRLSHPADHPPLYGPFSTAYTVRRFWGVSWHQMFRSFITGHADLIVDNVLPFLHRSSHLSRYLRLYIAFFISGAIHWRADQLMGVPLGENGAVSFFLLHALVIMLEDGITPVLTKLSTLLSAPLCRVLGWFWVLIVFIWSSPIWIYSSARLGHNTAALLPVRLVGPWISQMLA